MGEKNKHFNREDGWMDVWKQDSDVFIK